MAAFFISFSQKRKVVVYLLCKVNFHIMKRQVIRLTEQDLHRIISEAVERIISEDGEGGGGATNCAGTLQGGGTDPDAGTYTVPFGGVQRRKGYSAKGDKVSKGMTAVDMKPALMRKPNGSISMERLK